MKKAALLTILAALTALMASCGGGGGGANFAQNPAAGTIDAGRVQGDLSAAEVAPPELINAPEEAEAVSQMMSGADFSDPDDETDIDDAADIDSDIDSAGRIMERGQQAAPPLGASGGPSVNDYYVPAKAFDGIYSSWWAGKLKAKKWELFYGFQNAHNLTSLDLNFYSIDYLPKKTTVYTSLDGIHWTKQAKIKNNKSNGKGKKNDVSTKITLNVTAKYIRILMKGNPKSGFPIIRDIAWTPFVEKLGAYAAPGANDNYYFASNMFDGNLAKQWAGAAGVTEWNIYYHFAKPRMLGQFTVQLPNVNFRVPQMTLMVSEDGENWTAVGDLKQTYPPSLFVGREASYFRLQMVGAPASTYPVINEITFDLPVGAAGGPNEKEGVWTPANAFDGNLNTWWVGKNLAGAWDLFYSFAAPKPVNTVTIHFYAASHAAGTTELLTSIDGIDWTSAGTFPTGKDQAITLGKSAKFIHFKMAGNPLVGYPLVKDIDIK